MLTLLCSAPSVSQDQIDSSTDSQSTLSSTSRVAQRLMKRRNVLRRDSTSSTGSSAGSGSGSRLRLNISPPSAFKHYFHLGSDATAARNGSNSKPKEPWDEDKWREIIEMRMSLDGNFKVQLHTLQPDPPSPQMTVPADTVLDVSRSDSTATITPASSSTFSNESLSGPPEPPAKSPRAMKRTSLVKRKPVPPLYPDEPLPPRPSITSEFSDTKSEQICASKSPESSDSELHDSPRQSLSSVDTHTSGSTAPPPTPVDSELAEYANVDLLEKVSEGMYEPYETEN